MSDGINVTGAPAGNGQIKVSVAMITYNQAAFVRQALESVVTQDVPFPIEVVIGDDLSSDGTRAIVEEYAARDARIRPLLHERNQGMNRNFLGVIRACQGEYIAFLEGDDYWTDRQKLREQTRFMDLHDGCVLSHHRVSYVDSTGETRIREFPPENYRVESLPPEILARGNFIQTCALMVRRNKVPEITDEFYSLKLGDWPLCGLVSQFGQIGYVDKNMADYRVHHGSTWTPQSEEYKQSALLDVYKFLIKNLPRKANRCWAEAFTHVLLKRFKASFDSSSGIVRLEIAKQVLGQTALHRPFTLPLLCLRLIRISLRKAFNKRHAS